MAWIESSPLRRGLFTLLGRSPVAQQVQEEVTDNFKTYAMSKFSVDKGCRREHNEVTV